MVGGGVGVSVDVGVGTGLDVSVGADGVGGPCGDWSEESGAVLGTQAITTAMKIAKVVSRPERIMGLLQCRR